MWVRNFEGRRPYIDYEKSTSTKVAYREDFRAEKGEIYLREDEKKPYEKYEGFVYIEPNIKGTYSGNKDYGFHRWQQVVDLLPDVQFVQGTGERLRGVEQAATETFRHACGLLSRCRLFVGTDGGLHHAAAALDKPGVVVWGGLVSPQILGYEIHRNLHFGGKSCGSVGKCGHCRKAMEKITPQMVANEIRQALSLGRKDQA